MSLFWQMYMAKKVEHKPMTPLQKAKKELLDISRIDDWNTTAVSLKDADEVLERTLRELGDAVMGDKVNDADLVSKHIVERVSAHWGSLEFCIRCGDFAYDGKIDHESVCASYALGRLTERHDVQKKCADFGLIEKG
jgi:hypothetical protein